MKISSCIYFLFFIFIITTPQISLANEPIAIIVNRNNPTSDISSSDLEKMIKGNRTRWGDLQKIIKINWAIKSSVRRDFYRAVLKSEPTKKINLPSTGEPYDGIEVLNDKAMMAIVAATPNSLGYAYSSAVDNSVKVLRIDGYLPRDPGYPIK